MDVQCTQLIVDARFTETEMQKRLSGQCISQIEHLSPS